MREVEVTPAELVDAGAELSSAGTDLREDPKVLAAGMNVSAEDQLSGYGFPAGQKAQHLLDLASQKLVPASQRAADQCLALSSALYIVAEAYATGDLQDAVDFAFVETDEAPTSSLERLEDEVKYTPASYEPIPQMGPIPTHQLAEYYGGVSNDEHGPDSPHSADEGSENMGEHYADVYADRARRHDSPWGNHDHYEPPLDTIAPRPAERSTELQAQYEEPDPDTTDQTEPEALTLAPAPWPATA